VSGKLSAIPRRKYDGEMAIDVRAGCICCRFWRVAVTMNHIAEFSMAAVLANLSALRDNLNLWFARRHETTAG